MNNKSIVDEYELTAMQQGMLFNSLSAPHSGVDIEQILIALKETIAVAAFEKAWQMLSARYAVLRTCLQWENLSEPRQVVFSHVDLPFSFKLAILNRDA